LEIEDKLFFGNNKEKAHFLPLIQNSFDFVFLCTADCCPGFHVFTDCDDRANHHPNVHPWYFSSRGGAVVFFLTTKGKI
jgi:hypothetical protein